MAGLGRVQMRFNAAVATILTLAGFGRGNSRSAADEALKGSGHPIHRKFLRTLNPLRATGRDQSPYLGYCYGTTEARRRRAQAMRLRGLDPNDAGHVRDYRRVVEAPIRRRPRGWKIWNILRRTA